MKTIRIVDRDPIPKTVSIGIQGENNAETLQFVGIPELDDSQVEALDIILPDGSADTILLEDDAVTLTYSHMVYSGIAEAWLVVTVGATKIWKSERITLLIASVPDIDTPISQQYPTGIDQAVATAGASMTAAQEAAEDAEAWAVGQRGGEDVESTDETYQNNAKYYAEAAASSSTTAASSASAASVYRASALSYSRNAEAWAVGRRGGEDVEEDDETYQNNSKYYSTQSSNYANHANSYASAAYYHRVQADGFAEDAEAWAVGQRDGTDVDSTDSTYQNNAKYYAEAAATSASTAASAQSAVLGMTARATTLEAGQAATASYSSGVLTLGIPQGEKGDTGETGPQGVQGERGERGIQGVKGDTGETGATPVLAIGDVVKLDPDDDPRVQIGGTAENPILSFGIPQGVQGEQGPSGDINWCEFNLDLSNGNLYVDVTGTAGYEFSINDNGELEVADL